MMLLMMGQHMERRVMRWLMVMVTLTQTAAPANILSQLNLGNISMSFIVAKAIDELP